MTVVGIAIGVVLVLVVLFLTGAWRIAMRPFGIRDGDMTVEKLGFRVSDEADVALVHGICRAFGGGFNACIGERSDSGWERFSDSQDVHFRPFADEGAAMGYALRAMPFATPGGFEACFPRKRPAHVYLHYVGLGFWYAMRGAQFEKLVRVVRGLDRLHGGLCWDGYGFKFGFFDYETHAERVTALRDLPGYAAHVAHQGLGRSLWFRYMDDPAGLVEAVGACGAFASDAASGVGLAVAFTTIERIDRGMVVLDLMPEAWRADVLLGMCFAFKARSLNDRAYFEACLERMGPKRAEAVVRSISECDAVEESVRSEVDGALTVEDCAYYRRWRERLKSWLGEHIVYAYEGVFDCAGPEQGLKPGHPSALGAGV